MRLVGKIILFGTVYFILGISGTTAFLTHYIYGVPIALFTVLLIPLIIGYLIFVFMFNDEIKKDVRRELKK